MSWSARWLSTDSRSVRSRTNRSSWSPTSLRRPSSPSRTHACLTSYALALELRMRPWQEDVFDCNTDEPPDYRDSPAEIEDYARSRQIRLELEAASRAK